MTCKNDTEKMTLNELIKGSFEVYDLSISEAGIERYLHELQLSHDKIIYDTIMEHVKEEETLPPVVEAIKCRIRLKMIMNPEQNKLPN